uniref:ATP-binding protein n=1 Tax=Escherichia coli TaxID=562 RepID=UPI000BE423D4
LHHSHVVQIKGESYRLRQKRKAGVIADVNATIFNRYGDADDFLDCFIMPARIVGGTFQG